MRKLKIKMLAFKGAGEDIFEKGLKMLDECITEESFEMEEYQPDVIFFITGGSENEAAQIGSKLPGVALWAHPDDNSYASATETKAFLNHHGKRSVLWNIYDNNFKVRAKNFQKIINAQETLQDQQLGLLGKVSEWLIASNVSDSKLKERFGIDLVPISWNAIPLYNECKPSDDFNEHFNAGENSKLIEASKVHSLLDKTIKDNHLDAITVECFPLVNKYAVTACLSLALLNDRNIPAGCEGDLTSITGMMLSKALTGKIPWMANINKIETNKAKFAHCTVPVSMLTNYTIPTHFETNKGTAIQGDIKAETLTVFRFDSELKKLFLSYAQITDRPKSPNACRTQIEVLMPEEDLIKLKNKPLGNHHLFVEGDHREILALAAEWFGIEVM